MSGKRRFQGQQFQRRSARLPDVELDIVIPVYGRPDLLGECLRSVEAATLDVSYRLIVVDDKSPDAAEMEPVYAALNGQSRLIRHPRNVGFPAACNDGAAGGGAPAILFLNTDVVLAPGAVRAMLRALWSDDTPPAMVWPQTGPVGVVGPVLVFHDDTPYGPPGRVQHAGISFDMAGKPIHVNIGWSPDNPKLTMRRCVQAVTGACLMTRRETWARVTAEYRKAGDPSTGGFNLVYGRGTYEDIEFCFAARSHGYRVVVEPAARATHHVGASSAAKNEPMPLGRNDSIFRARCGHLMLWDQFLHY